MNARHHNRSLALVLATLVLTISAIQEAQAAAWTTNSPMIKARYAHTVTLLPNGKLLATGGYGTNPIPSLNYLSIAEVHDPASGTWAVTGSQAVPRNAHTATLLPCGKVLVVGGTGVSSSAELYDPASGTWTPTGAPATARENHTATLLPNGLVLVVGGEYGHIVASNSLASAELYDPATGSWTATGTLHLGRYQHTATLLPSGKVLVVGGVGNRGFPTTAELYDPASGTWATTGPLSSARAQHTATLLPDGRVLAAGGNSTIGLPIGPSAELYDPVAETWAATGGLATNRFGHTATLLPNGKVLAIGGYNGGVLSSAELYDPANGTWSAAGILAKARQLHTATVLPNGKVLVAGGQGSLVFSDAISKVELYDSANGAWTVTGALNTGRMDHSETLLPNGKVLAAGGHDFGIVHSSAELYDPAAGTWRVISPLVAPRYWHTATLLPTGKVLLTGGLNTSSYLSSAVLYDPPTETWLPTGDMTADHCSHTATLLFGGKVLVAGGNSSASYRITAELYDPAAGTWTATGPMTNSRAFHTATLLPSGKVLVVGGYPGGTSTLSGAELYDPATGRWKPTGALKTARSTHTATLLLNGKVLVTGGWDTSGHAFSSTELYDPETGGWTYTGTLNTRRFGHAAILLLNGKVLVAGGKSDTTFGQQTLADTEVYDPATGSWSVTGSLNVPHETGTALLLNDGKVLVAGGLGKNGVTNSAELYDAGLGFNAACQPQIATATSPLSLGGSLVLTGSGFRGVSEGSGGNTQASSADYPVVQLRSLESGQTTFLLATNWQTNSFTSAPVWGFPPGYALATMYVNGIPSTGSVVNIRVPVPTATMLTDAKRLTTGACQFRFTNAVGALFGVLASTNPALPLSNWSALGGVTEVAPGQFQFTDPQATNSPQRFYRLRAP